MFRVKNISNNIFLLVFDKREKMCRTLLRFQEHYESPKFRNKIFSLKEFKEWYPKSKGLKRFTYYHDWDGFNFPSDILRPFYSGKFTQLSVAEKKILKTFKNQKGKFYVIATAQSGNIKILKHEIAHAMFYLDKQYKADASSVIETLDQKEYKSFTDNLKTLGYDKSVYVDEAQAYLISDAYKDLMLKGWKTLAKSKKTMVSIFKEKIKDLNINYA